MFLELFYLVKYWFYLITANPKVVYNFVLTKILLHFVVEVGYVTGKYQIKYLDTKTTVFIIKWNCIFCLAQNLSTNFAITKNYRHPVEVNITRNKFEEILKIHFFHRPWTKKKNCIKLVHYITILVTEKNLFAYI